MKKFPRAIPRMKSESPRFKRGLIGWIRKRLVLLCGVALCVSSLVYSLFFYRINNITVKYTEESGKDCLNESKVIEVVSNEAIVNLAQGNFLQSNLGSQFSCIENISLSWRGLWAIDVWVMTTKPIIAVVKLENKQGSAVEDEVFYVNKYGDIVKFQAAIGLPRVYLKPDGQGQQSSYRFLESQTLAKLLQVYDFFSKELGSAPRIEILKGGHAKVSTAEISSLLIDLKGDLENQLRRYLYIVGYLRDRNQQIMQIDVRYNWSYVKSQD